MSEKNLKIYSNLKTEEEKEKFVKYRNNWVKSKLRQHSTKWEPKNEAKKLARTERGKYRCAECLETFGPTQIEMDHIQSVIDVTTGWQDFNSFIERLFVPVEGYSALCRLCHEHKTAMEDARRSYHNQLKKKK